MAEMHSRFGLEHAGQDDIANAIELWLVAKEEGFPNCDFIQEATEFPARHWLGGQAVEIFPGGTKPQCLYPFLALLVEEAQPIIGLKNARSLVDQVADLHQRWRRAKGQPGRRSCGGSNHRAAA